jgi:AcrR family transcriptional regulator
LNYESFSYFFKAHFVEQVDTQYPAPPVAQPERQERAQRILDVAADLLLRWGYKRITMDDIAQQVGIGTGTVYLHWKTKEALFESVLLRELLAVWHTLIARMQADSSEILLHRFLRAQTLIIGSRPLARALFTKDAALLGKLTQSSVALQNQQVTTARELIALLRSQGLMRSDADLAVQAYAFSAMVTGAALADQFLLEADRVPLEVQADAIALLAQRTFEPDTLPSADVLRNQIAPAMIQALEQVCVFYEQQLQSRLVSPS